MILEAEPLLLNWDFLTSRRFNLVGIGIIFLFFVLDGMFPTAELNLHAVVGFFLRCLTVTQWFLAPEKISGSNLVIPYSDIFDTIPHF